MRTGTRRRTKRGAERRIPLNRERVLRAAVALADKHGVGTLTMRQLGHELGVEAMALYNHVTNKDDLLDGMVDVVFSEIDLPSGADWKTAMRHRALSARRVLAHHSWAIGLMESRVKPGPANLRHHDSVIALLREAGFSIEMAVHAFSAVNSYIYGFALQEASLPFGSSEELADVAEVMVPRSFADTYPHLTEVADELVRKSYDYGSEFEFGLDLILDGLEKIRDTV